MADPFTNDLAGKGLTGIVAAILTLAGTLFATRKTSESRLAETLNERIDSFIQTQTKELAECKADHLRCHRALTAVARRLGLDVTELFEDPIPSYTNADIERAERVGREARKRNKEKPE